MAKKKNKNNSQKNSSYTPRNPVLKSETKYGILAVISFMLSIFFLMSLFDFAGKAGELTYEFFHYLVGVGYILLPILLGMLGSSLLRGEQTKFGWMQMVASALFLLSGLGMIDVASGTHAGGAIGKVLGVPFVTVFDVYASIIFLGAILLISIFTMFDTKPDLVPIFKKIWALISRKKEILDEKIEQVYKDEEVESKEEEPEVEEKEAIKKTTKKEESKESKNEEEEFNILKSLRSKTSSGYTPPPISLLEEDKGKPNTGDVKANSIIIKRTLQNFGIEVEMDEITIGPTVTRYALKPAEGVKLSKIIGLQNDLALALAAHPIRIEAPIPGKSLVGIEIPNKAKSIVGLATMLQDEKFYNSGKALTVALGRSISGKAMFGNLAKMPHCLVAGTTGSGKSVAIHAIVASLLYRNGPDDLKLILIDPKRVELTLYKNIPHLLTPVITDAKKAILALKWAAKEMDRRYDILEQETVRDIGSYHQNIINKKTKKDKEGEEPDRMPYIVIIIDELADIMSSYPRELESAIVRLAQMSRAVGIHLILSTQRPEVNVITGLIKANIPARIALKVSSQIDSRTILDAGGAEKLLGAGDMLYSSGEASPERLQSAFISETEVKKVVEYLTDAYKDELASEILLSEGSISHDKSIFDSSLVDEDEDEMYEEARACVVEAGKASTSFLQRKLKLGYARAARLMDMLEERGVVSAGDGAKPREVLEKIERDSEGNNTVM
ncbi:MAG: DNA translocase FtsK [Candidatus Pacebacteria bacterium]|nr:DNA translocase FtsK [Candidatus Paceibacterota bacterium]MCF7862626.1 DNA translocase FtsK [Candidatus Paceibacterota bacterium]